MLLNDSRAFLVRLRDRIEPAAPEPMGRIEHLDSGLSRRFSSFQEMCDFISKVLANESAVETEERQTEERQR